MNCCDAVFETSLHYASPAHGGWGVLKTGQLIPESYHLFVSPAACGRHGALAARLEGRNRTVSYYHLTEQSIVSGDYEKEIPAAVELLLGRLTNNSRANFSVSSQHLPFAMRAYQELLNAYMPEEYNAAIRENNTSAVLHDVSSERSELGIAVFQEEQLDLMRRSLYVHDLQFTELEKINTFVFLRKLHPLAGHESLSLSDLQEYPFVTYDQDETPSYYTEEYCSYSSFKKHIHVCDRATKMFVIRRSDAFSIGVDLPNFNLDIYVQKQVTGMEYALLAAIPFADQIQPVKVGYLSKNGHTLSPLGEQYISLLVEQIGKLSLPGALTMASR